MKWFLQLLFSNSQLQPCRVWEEQGSLGWRGGQRFPPDIHHFSPTYSCYHRDGDYSNAGITEAASRVLCYKETNSTIGVCLSRRTITPDVHNAQKELSPAAVAGLKPVSTGEGEAGLDSRNSSSCCFCTEKNRSIVQPGHIFCCIRDDLSVTSGRWVEASLLSLSPFPPLFLSRLPSLSLFLCLFSVGSAQAAQSVSPLFFSAGEADSGGTTRFQHHGERPTSAARRVW